MRRPTLPSPASAAVAIAVVLLYTNLPVTAAHRGALPTAAAALVPLLLAAAVVHRLVGTRGRLAVDRTLLLMCGFLVILLLSTFRAEGYGVAVDRIVVYATEGVLVYALIRNAVTDQRRLDVAIGALIFAAGLLASLTVIQAVTGNYGQDYLGLAQRSLAHLEDAPPSVAARTGLEDRARGPVDDPNRFAQILLMAAPLALVAARNAHRLLPAVLAACTGILVLAAILITYSRGAFIALLALALLTAPLRLVRPSRLVALALVAALITPTIPGYTERIGSIAGVAGLFGPAAAQPDGPTRGRTTEMLAALAAYSDHPVLGVGPGQYLPYHSVHYQSFPEISIRDLPTPRRAHNLYLELAAESGTIGLVVFMSIPLLLIRDLELVRRRLARRRPDLARLAAGFTLALLAYLGTGVFLHLAFERYYWFMVALAAAAASILGARASDGRRRAGPVASTGIAPGWRAEGEPRC